MALLPTPGSESFKEEQQMRERLTYANVVATLALVVAVAGGSTAIAVSASKSSDVNKKGNIRAGRVSTTKLADGAVTGAKLGPTEIVQTTVTGGGSVACPAGDRLFAGGGMGGNLNASYPDGNAWVVSAPPGSVTIYALCLR
jgi:hypothetical protein